MLEIHEHLDYFSIYNTQTGVIVSTFAGEVAKFVTRADAERYIQSDPLAMDCFNRAIELEEALERTKLFG